MKSVYQASSGLDAHMILNLLTQHGITGRVDGEYLQGGIGELQAMGFVHVRVTEEDYPAALNIIQEWEAAQPPEEARQDESVPGAGGIQLFLAGFVLGAALMYWWLTLPSA